MGTRCGREVYRKPECPQKVNKRMQTDRLSTNAYLFEKKVQHVWEILF